MKKIALLAHTRKIIFKKRTRLNTGLLPQSLTFNSI